MRKFVMTVVAVGAVVLLALPALAQNNATDAFDCDDFTYQQDAQAVFDADPADPNGLDGPIGPVGDGQPGVACETLPSSPSPSPSPLPSTPATQGTVPATRVDAGGGGCAAGC